MNDSTKEMCDSIKIVKTDSFSELEGSENISIDSSWTRRLVSPWGLFFPIEGTGNIALGDDAVPAPKGTFLFTNPGTATPSDPSDCGVICGSITRSGNT